MLRGTHNNHKKGAEHYRWSRERMITKDGYVKLRVGTGHPLSDRNGYAYEHLVVWVSAGNDKPAQNSVLHHVNEDKTDNRLGNLEMMSRTDHGAHHRAWLSDIQIRAIRTRYDAGEDGTAIAKDFGIGIAQTYKIIKGERRGAAGGPIQRGSLRYRANKNRVGKKTPGRVSKDGE